MTLNLQSDIGEQAKALDQLQWTPLQTKICMAVANAKYHAFVVETKRMAEFVELGFLTRATAVDYLHQTAIYNQLPFEYGRDAIQQIMADAFSEVVEC
jgi:hypothetical protein